LKLVNGIKFEYVAGSSIGYFKLKNSDKEIEKWNFEDFSEITKFSLSKLRGYIDCSYLFNAYQEKTDAELLHNYNKLNHTNSYSDSGGLQATRKNITIENEFKEEIYKIQAKYSDYAMTFDEMPLKLIESNKTGDKVGSADRVYIRELIKPTAKLSAKHIQHQVNVFNDLETNTKILPILHGFRPKKQYHQGRDDNTYCDYAKYLLDDIKNVNNHIQGISIASLTTHADNRVGVVKLLDYVPRILSDKNINDDYLEHIHLLGLSSMQRLLPMIIMAKNGIIDNRVKTISFDSTSINRAAMFGRVYKNENELKYPTHQDYKNFKVELGTKSFEEPDANNVRQLYQQVHNLFKDYPNYMFNAVDEFGLTGWESLAKHSQNNGDSRTLSQQYKAAKDRNCQDYILRCLQQYRLTLWYHTHTFLDTVERFIDGEVTSYDLFGYNNEIYSMYSDLEYNVNDMNSLFDVVEKYHSRLKVGIDNSTDTLKQFEELHKKDSHFAEFGHQAPNILF